MKRILYGLITALTAFCILTVNCFASGDYLYELSSLGIISGDENGEYHLEDTMTRAELVSCVARLMGFDELSGGIKADTQFEDVPLDAWYADEVYMMAALGIIHGTSKDRFDPMAEIQYEQAVKIMVNILGYGKVAEEQGGYPTGYMNLASRLGLLKNVKSVPFTRESVMRIIYNSLDVQILEDTGTGEMSVYGNTLRKNLMEGDSDTTILENQGIVTANADTYLISADSTFGDEEIEIDGVRYDATGVDISGLLGLEVDFYAEVDDYGDNKLISVKPSKNNTVTVIDEKDFIRIEGEKLHYYKNENQKTQANISSSCKFVKNGRLLKQYTQNDLTLFRGTVTAVDNNNDRELDVIFIDDFYNVRVADVSENTIVLNGNDRIDGKKYVTIDDEDDDIRIAIYNKDGSRITVDMIEENSILSVTASDDATYIKLVCENNNITGRINEINDEELLVDEAYYKLYSADSFDVSVGDNAVVYLDYRGYVAYVEKISMEEQYAYVLSSARDEELYENLNVKLIIGKKIQMHYSKNEENLDDTDLIPSIVCENENVRKLRTVANVKIDGTKFTGDNIPEGLYRYTLNKDGEIRTLHTALFAGGGNGMKYNVYDKTFGANKANTPIAIDDDTIVVCIPKNQDASGSDYLIPLEISDKETTRTFDVSGYDFDKETKKVNIIVFKELMNSSSIPKIDPVSGSPSVGLVKSANVTLNEDEDLCLKLVLVTKQGTKETVINNIEGKNEFFKKLKNGDLIYYVNGLDGEIANYQIISSLKNIDKSPFHINKGRVDEKVFGRVVDIEYDEIDNDTNRLVNVIDMMSETSVSVNVNKRNSPVIFVYDSGGGYAEVGTIEDVVPKDDERLFVLRPYSSTVRAIVVVK